MVTDENGTLAGRFLPRLYPRTDYHRPLAAIAAGFALHRCGGAPSECAGEMCRGIIHSDSFYNSQATLIMPSIIDKQGFGEIHVGCEF